MADAAERTEASNNLLTAWQYNGSKGVELAINLLYDEFKLTMGLAGSVILPCPAPRVRIWLTSMCSWDRCKSISEINRGHLSILETNGVLSRL